MSENNQNLEFKKGSHFVGLVIKTSMLTLITLGIYRFWQTAKLRRYYWSAIHINDDPLEFRGTGLEAFLGFLIVLVIIALYLTVVLSGLYFAGLVTFANIEIVQLISIVALMPFAYLAQYRFRRYIAARTRWRGIRFGVEKGAFGYMWRGLAYLGLFIVTLGLSGPYGRFKLDKFMSDRTWLGNFQLKQMGDWKQLWKYYTPLWASALLIACGGVMLFLGAERIDGFGDEMVAPIVFMVIGYVLTLIFSIYYSIRSQIYLLSQKTLGDRVGFHASFTTRGTVGRVLLGLLLSSIVASLVMFALVLVGLIIALIFSIFMPVIDWDVFAYNETLAGILVIAAVIPLYVGMLVAMSIANEIFVKAVMIEYFTNHITVINAKALDDIEQREQDDLADADGWGEALDVGFGF